MAGLFEESGRLLAFKTILSSYQDRDIDALMYGAGHGGFEALVLLGVSMIINIVYSLQLNNGAIDSLTASLSGEALDAMMASLQALSATPAYQFLIGIIERISAIILQLSLSVLVWFAGKKHLYLYFIAIAIHMLVDAGAVILSGSGVPILFIEVLIALASILSALYAERIWKRYSLKNNVSGI